VRNHIEVILCVDIGVAIDIAGEEVKGLFIDQASNRPKIVTEKAAVFKVRGRGDSGIGLSKSQLTAAPPDTAPIVIKDIADDKSVLESQVFDNGELELGAHSADKESRAEYAAVRAVAKKNIKIIKMLVGDIKVVSRIASFE